MYKQTRNDECLICQGSLLEGISLYHLLIDDNLCFKCRKPLKTKVLYTQFLNRRLISFYTYNNEVSQILIRYKDLLDKPLGPVFLKEYMWIINILYKDYKLVLIPSSKTLEARRGFNHLKGILTNCKLEIIDCFEKTNKVQRFSYNRSQVSFKFKINVEKFDKLIIFDDVITSGSSMLEAIRLLDPISNEIILMSITTNAKLFNKKGELHAGKSKMV